MILALVYDALVYKEGVWSDLGYFAIADFHDCLFEIFLPLRPEVEGTAVGLRQSVSIAVYKWALAFSSQEADLLLARKAFLFVNLDGFFLNWLLFFFQFRLRHYGNLNRTWGKELLFFLMGELSKWIRSTYGSRSKVQGRLLSRRTTGRSCRGWK
jgi:hypothetical protein